MCVRGPIRNGESHRCFCSGFSASQRTARQETAMSHASLSAEQGAWPWRTWDPETLPEGQKWPWRQAGELLKNAGPLPGAHTGERFSHRVAAAGLMAARGTCRGVSKSGHRFETGSRVPWAPGLKWELCHGAGVHSVPSPVHQGSGRHPRLGPALGSFGGTDEP